VTVIEKSQRKIIHVDMDCFYAAIEIRDNPALADKPVAVGGSPDQRGVLCTCNYIARQYGIRSAMPTAFAFRLCKDLVLVPVNMAKYRAAAAIIHEIFREYTDLVEPLSLDEAYLDVTDSPHEQGIATNIAKAIRQKIMERINITASAGVAPNKFLAKIASGWRKPNGLFVIRPHEVDNFIKELPVKDLFGVGKVTAEKLHAQGLKNCADVQQVPLTMLTEQFGKFGAQLYERSRGIDERSVEPNRIRKSLSVEHTFSKNIRTMDDCLQMIEDLYEELLHRIKSAAADRLIKNQYIKIKYGDFKQVTIVRISKAPDLIQFKHMLYELNKREDSIRLLGLGVHFQVEEKMPAAVIQQSLL
jgi:DNA polymerase-4